MPNAEANSICACTFECLPCDNAICRWIKDPFVPGQIIVLVLALVPDEWNVLHVHGCHAKRMLNIERNLLHYYMIAIYCILLMGGE